jgi:hypothetical protein
MAEVRIGQIWRTGFGDYRIVSKKLTRFDMVRVDNSYEIMSRTGPHIETQYDLIKDIKKETGKPTWF